MRTCGKCGCEIDAGAEVCPGCLTDGEISPTQIGEAWLKDSSIGKWFPFSARQLLVQEGQLFRAKHLARRWRLLSKCHFDRAAKQEREYGKNSDTYFIETTAGWYLKALSDELAECIQDEPEADGPCLYCNGVGGHVENCPGTSAYLELEAKFREAVELLTVCYNLAEKGRLPSEEIKTQIAKLIRL